jgi:hypothetical protein
MVEDYAYAETDFRGDPNLALLEGEYWGDIGEKDIFIIIFFCHFYYKNFMLCIQD